MTEKAPSNTTLSTPPKQSSQTITSYILKSTEKLDRTSPELWPAEKVVSVVSEKKSAGNSSIEWKLRTLADENEEKEIKELQSLNPTKMAIKMKHLENETYQMEIDEAHELARGKFLKILDP